MADLGCPLKGDMGVNLNHSLKGFFWDCIGNYCSSFSRDTRNLDHGSYATPCKAVLRASF